MRAFVMAALVIMAIGAWVINEFTAAITAITGALVVLSLGRRE